MFKYWVQKCPLYSTTFYHPLPDLSRGSLPDWNLKPETQNANTEIQKFLHTSFPGTVPQQATSCHLPVAWSLDIQCCNNECCSIVKEDCNGNMSFENEILHVLEDEIGLVCWQFLHEIHATEFFWIQPTCELSLFSFKLSKLVGYIY